MKNLFRLVASLGVSAALLALMLRHVDLGAVLATAGGVDWRQVVLAGLAIVAVQVARAARWQRLVAPFAPLSAAAAWRVSNVGNLMVTLLPLRLGELSRPYLMRRDYAASFSSVMGAVAVERVLDGLLVTALFFCATAALGPTADVPPALWAGALAALGVFAAAAAGLAVAMMRASLLATLLRRLVAPISPALATRLAGMVAAFVAGLRALPGGRGLARLVAWTLAYWAANALALAWVMRAFGWSLPPVAPCILVCVLVIGVMVPAGPGFLGTFQAALVTGLGIFAVPREDALAYALIVYPLTLGVTVALGLPYLVGRDGLRLGDLVRAGSPPPGQARGPWQRRPAYRQSERRRAPL